MRKNSATKLPESTSTDSTYEPVDLDPTPPALAHWRAIADNDAGIVHDGDASVVIPFARPAWADPDWDIVSDRAQQSRYCSAPVKVLSSSGAGELVGDVLYPARAVVKVKQYGDATTYVDLALRQTYGNRTDGDTPWRQMGILFTADEILELADVLRAAAALIAEGGQ